MQTFCALTMLPKLPFNLNVKASAKSSHSRHEDFVDALTFGKFGDAFSVLIAQKLAILVDPISTFHKVGIVGS
jgi:hypothetical protein